MNLFARGERVVTHALAVAERPGELPQLLGQKLDKLSKERLDCPAVLKAIDGFREFIELRNVIVHNEGRVFADLKGGWILQFEDWSGKILRRVSDDEGEVLRRDVQQAVDRLASRLAINSRSSGPADTPSA